MEEDLKGSFRKKTGTCLSKMEFTFKFISKTELRELHQDEGFVF